jgi:L-fuconolactonase
MFGSDWPVCLLAAPYGEVVEAMRSITGDDPNVFGETAAQVYRLDRG